MRSLARRPLAVAKNMVHGDIAAAAVDETTLGIGDGEGRVADTAFQRLKFHAACPARELADTIFE
jgi:hypothetical protein